MYTKMFVGAVVACLAVGIWAVSARAHCEQRRADGSIATGASNRPYILYAADSTQPRPLVVVFHGGGGPLGSPQLMLEHSGWKEVADKHCVSVAFLFGTPEYEVHEVQIDSTQPGYNPLMWKTEARDTEDTDYVSRVIDDIESRIEVDPARIYATGFSNGGTFTYKVAHALPGVFAAIAPIEAATLEYLDTPSPVSLMSISGVPIELAHLPSTAAVSWASNAGCTKNSVAQRGTVTERTWHGCAVSIREIFVGGMGHEYPGAAHLFGTDSQYTNVLSAAEEAWDFFESKKTAVTD